MEYSFDNILLDGLAVFFSLMFLVTIRSFLTIMPKLFASIGRWKIHLEIEDSHQLARSRNLVFMVLFIPGCLFVQSYSLYKPEFMSGLSAVLQFGLTVGTALAYLFLRMFLNWQLEMRNFGSRTFIAANRSFYNYSIILFLLMFFCGAVLRVFVENEDLIRIILLQVAALSYIIHMFKRAQIFSSVCNPFTTFLYLCSLELLPTGILVLSAALL